MAKRTGGFESVSTTVPAGTSTAAAARFVKRTFPSAAWFGATVWPLARIESLNSKSNVNRREGMTPASETCVTSGSALTSISTLCGRVGASRRISAEGIKKSGMIRTANTPSEKMTSRTTAD